jgi:hypothetical protein
MLNFRNDNLDIDKLNSEYDNIMTKKTMFNAMETDRLNLKRELENSNKNVINHRNQADPNIDVNNQVYLSKNNNEKHDEIQKKSKPSNLADIEIFDNQGNLYLENMQFPLIYLFAGKPASGKSVAIKNLIYNYSKLGYFKFILAIVPSKFNSGYEYLPDKYVIESYDENYLKNYFNKLREFKKKSGFIPANALILDDILGSINLYSSFWQHFFSTYRHYNCTIIFGSQTITGKGAISTLLRQVCNVCVMYRNVFQDNIEQLYKAFGGLMEDYNEFQKVFLNVTSTKYHGLLFANDRESKQNSYYDYISDVSPDFKLNY